MRSEIKIKKRNDVLESFSNEKIKKTIEKASFGFTDQIDLNLIVNQVGQEVKYSALVNNFQTYNQLESIEFSSVLG